MVACLKFTGTDSCLPSLPHFLPHPVPPPDFLSIPRWALQGCGSQKKSSCYTSMLFLFLRWQRRSDCWTEYIWIFLLYKHLNLEIGAMGGLQCIKYLVFVFNFLFWVCSVTYTVLVVVDTWDSGWDRAAVWGIRLVLYNLKQFSLAKRRVKWALNS